MYFFHFVIRRNMAGRFLLKSQAGPNAGDEIMAFLITKFDSLTSIYDPSVSDNLFDVRDLSLEIVISRRQILIRCRNVIYL